MRKIKKGLHIGIALIANLIYGMPGKRLKLIGVTGTDGKTTTVLMIYHILKNAGYKVGYISTIGYDVGGKRFDQGLHVTTPSSLVLQKLLRAAVNNKLTHLVLESSSHGLDQNRLLGCHFEVSVITNITPEHLDYHKTYDNYLNTKAKLLSLSKVKLINKGDRSYKELIKKFPDSIAFEFEDFGFAEKYNNENAAAAAKVCKEIGIKEKEIKKYLKSFEFPAGRYDVVQKKPFTVIVDFAHTPNGLINFLSSLPKSSGKLIHIFGCAGERDKYKRPEMGKNSASFADIIILTAEDPRSEKVEDINGSIKKGIPKSFKGKLIEVHDRGKAIATGIKLAKVGDRVVITGKGPEKSNNIGGVEYPWSDLEEVKKYLE